MRCLWCETILPELHVTRMIAHLLQLPGMRMDPCLGKNDRMQKIYQDLFDRKNFLKVEKSKSMKTKSSQLKTLKAPRPRHWCHFEDPHCYAPL